MPNLETLLANMGVRITVVCEGYEPAELPVHELTTACTPVKIVEVSIRIKGESECNQN